jgi:hypothetical protein
MSATLENEISDIRNESEDTQLEKESQWIDLNFRKEQLESNRQDRQERKKYAICIFLFLCGFLGVTLALVATSKCSNLSDAVLITLLTTTSADIIGIFIIVVKYLFKSK